MIYLYPANKMENLLVLLDKIQHISPLPIFSKDIVIVQNAGMQHWLNMSLAQQRGISMNIDYALPSQYLWKLIRTLASDEAVPEQSPYSREVLTWRIYSLLASAVVCDDPDFAQPTEYWLGSHTLAQCDNEHLAHKRFQLAGQLADLYEQYLIFRPQWLDLWHKQHSAKQWFTEAHSHEISLWQAKLWFLLTQQQPYNPITLIEQAVCKLKQKTTILPPRISFFGINAMAPIWLTFIHALSEYIDIHFFHLNPCFAYWGDILTEKQAISAIAHWVDGHDDISQSVGNPLLANLGQQGREFMALLQNYSTINIDVFDVISPATNLGQERVLAKVQQDILSLNDARLIPTTVIDNSIVITSCHSALREVQGLHDWLLHQFNQDKTLTPKDVLVMCPQVEQYAPYVNAVFVRGWQDLNEEIPPLPCSIADRISKDSEPVVAAFSQLLNLPDSRFHVSQLVGLLRLPAMQTKFGIAIEEIDKMSVWLEQASIHWGLDKPHKQHILKTTSASNNFTWQQGLSKLLLGFAYGDQTVIYQNQLLLATIEGNDALLLGKLMLIIEQLQWFSNELNRARTAAQWQVFLYQLLDELFTTEVDNGFLIINQAIESLVEHCSNAHFNEAINLLIVRDFLNEHFSQPDPGRQFMVGQVTFCSMLPMRSIPFKVIAVLGLNDGEFPRQRQPLGFDLMSITPAKLGDRSRRGDDRYLFLEAIISARQALYLSYQGRNIKNNAEKQPSLVLKELMEYLQRAYGWRLLEGDEHAPSQLRQLPMQPFSEKNYLGEYRSFDPNWLALTQRSHADNNSLEIPVVFDEPLTIDAAQVIAFFHHPAKYFAQQQLNLYLEHHSIELEDAEPFATDQLQSYLLRQQLLEDYLTHLSANDQQVRNAVNLTLQSASLSGKFPESPVLEQTFERWRHDSEVFSSVLDEQQAANPQWQSCTLALEVAVPCVEQQQANQSVTVVLTAKLPVKNEQLVFYRSSQAKAKDFFTLYLHQLIVQVWQQERLCSTAQVPENNNLQNALLNVNATQGFYFDTKRQKITQYRYGQVHDAKSKLQALLATFLVGQQRALLLNGELAEKYFKANAFSQADFQQLWTDANAFLALGADPYMKYFWPNCPKFSPHEHQLVSIYQPIIELREQIK